MITIEREKCIGCGNCLKDCFGNNIKWRDGKAEIKGECFKCGHCVAICPTDAVTIQDDSDIQMEENPEGVSAVLSEELLYSMQFRRSIRNYKKIAVEQDKIKKILEAGRYAPTAGNAQDVRYIVVRDSLQELKPFVWQGLINLADRLSKEKPENPYSRMWYQMYERYQLGTEDHLFFDAPVLLVVTAAELVNGVLAAANIELMSNAEGLGCLYSGFIQRGLQNNPLAAKLLDVNPEKICLCMLLGYPSVTYRKSAPRKRAEIEWK